MKIRLVLQRRSLRSRNLGALTPKPVALDELAAGEVGFIVANIKRVADAQIGDTITDAARPAAAAARIRSDQADGVRRAVSR